MEIGDRNGRPVSTIRQLTVIMFDEEIHFCLISVIVDTLQSIRQPTGRLAPALARLATSSLAKTSAMLRPLEPERRLGPTQTLQSDKCAQCGEQSSVAARGTCVSVPRMSPH